LVGAQSAQQNGEKPEKSIQSFFTALKKQNTNTNGESKKRIAEQKKRMQKSILK
jgi:hypothetical protein